MIYTGLIIRSLIIMGCVAPLLTVINQYEAIVALDSVAFSVWKFVLTCLVPFVVSFISGYLALREQKAA